MPFSAVSVLHYKYYDNKEAFITQLLHNPDIQTIIGKSGERRAGSDRDRDGDMGIEGQLIPFGTSQQPALSDYADGADTMAFLCGI